MSDTSNNMSPTRQPGLFANENALRTIRPDAAAAFVQLAVSITEVESLLLDVESIRKFREQLRNRFPEETIRQIIDQKDRIIAWHNTDVAQSMPTKQDAAIRGMNNAIQVYNMSDEEFNCFERMLRQQLVSRIQFQSPNTKDHLLPTNFAENIVISWATLKHATTRRIKITERGSNNPQHNLAAYAQILRTALPKDKIEINRPGNRIFIRNPSSFASRTLMPSG